jgi:transposase InsO family protein
MKRRKRMVAAPRTVLPPPTKPNHRWSMDLVSDVTETGRRFRVLAIVDDFTRRSTNGAYQRQVRLHFIRPGKPVENAYVESFNGKLGMSASTPTGSRMCAPRSLDNQGVAARLQRCPTAQLARRSLSKRLRNR